MTVDEKKGAGILNGDKIRSIAGGGGTSIAIEYERHRRVFRGRFMYRTPLSMQLMIKVTLEV
jgi:hypothetical protein